MIRSGFRRCSRRIEIGCWLAVDGRVSHATGKAEREKAIEMVARRPGGFPLTVGADKAYDSAEFVQSLRSLGAAPHVAQSDTNRSSAIDGRTIRHEGYDISQRRWKRIEEIFGWGKTIGGIRKVRHRGVPLVDWMFTFTVAVYDLVRMRKLVMETG
jgi:hypothetical protein